MKKAISYARVSSKDQEREGFSIPAQIELLKRYAHDKGFRIVKTFKETDTAKKAGRKQFDQMICFLRENSDCRDLLVEKTDRLYRNFKDYVDLDPAELDLRIHFVKEGTCLHKDSRSSDKFIHTIKVAVAKNFIDNLSEEVKKGQREKARQGMWPSSAPIGYLNRREDHTIVPDPDRAPLIRQGFELAATGQYSLNKLSEMLYRKGLRSVRAGNRLTKQGMARMLRNPIYHGEFIWKERRYPGRHEALISKSLFDQVQVTMGFVQKQRFTKHAFVYSGLLTCGHCGCAITAERKTKKSGRTYVYYHCTNGKGVCQNVVYLREERIDSGLAAALKALEIPEDVIALTRTALLESSRDEKDFREGEIGRLHRRYRKLDQYLSQCYEDRLEGRIELDLWEDRSRAWKEEQGEILAQIDALKQANTRYAEEGLRLMELARQAHTLFLEMKPEEKRELLGLVLSNPQVVNGNVQYSYKLPFSMFLEATDLKKWRGRRDSNSRPPA